MKNYSFSQIRAVLLIFSCGVLLISSHVSSMGMAGAWNPAWIVLAPLRTIAIVILVLIFGIPVVQFFLSAHAKKIFSDSQSKNETVRNGKMDTAFTQSVVLQKVEVCPIEPKERPLKPEAIVHKKISGTPAKPPPTAPELKQKAINQIMGGY